MKKYLHANILILFLLPGLLKAEEIKVPVIDGMNITLGNYVQYVQARAKSLGPGLCAVTFSLSTTPHQQTRFFAPIFTWSDWQDIKPAFVNGPITIKVNYTEECDTGALAEIKYHK